MATLSQTQEHYWRDRYALRDSSGNTVEKSIYDTWGRVAKAIGDTVDERVDFYSLLLDFKFVPGGRILAGAGAESQKTFYNCYVIPVETKARRHNRSSQPLFTVRRDVSEEEGHSIRKALDEWSRSRHPWIISEDIEIHTLPLEDTGNDSREAIFDTINTMVGIMSRGGGVGINWSTLRPRDSYLTRVSGHSSGPVGWMDVASKAVGEVIQGGSRRGAAMFMLDIWHPDVLNFIDAKRDNTKITNANVSVGVSDAFMEALENDEDWTFIFPDTTHEAYNEFWDGDIRAWQDRGLPVVEWGTRKASEIWDAIASSAHASGEPGVIFLDRYNELSTANGEERIICVNPCGEQGLGAYSVCNLGAMNLYAYILAETGYSPSGKSFDFERFAADVKTAIRFLDNVIDKTPDYLPETRERQERLRRIGLGVMGLADALVALGIRYGSPEAVEFTEDVFRCMKDAAIEASSLLANSKGPARGWNAQMLERPFLKEFVERRPDWTIGHLRNLFLLTQAPTGTTSLLADVNSGIEPYFNKKSVWREDRTGGRFVYPRALQDMVDSRGSIEMPDYVVDSSEVTVEEHIAMQAAVQKYVDSSVSKTINAPAEQTVEETAKGFSLAYERGLKGIAYYRDGSRGQQVLYHQNPNERIRELEAEISEMKKSEIYAAQASDARDEISTWPQWMQDNLSPSKVQQILLSPMGNDCPSCGEQVVHQEGCMKCLVCGWSAC